jgi:exonuclease SbcC
MRLFRQHVDGSVEFPDGLVGVIGSNGSGKSTILEAIGFALFGSRALRGRVEDVRTRFAPSKAGRGKRERELLVELQIERDGVVFRIERSLADAKLFVGGEGNPVAEGNREVSARIASLIGMSYEEFIATYCTEQKGLEFLSGKKGATEREKFIIRVLGYDRLEELQELLRSDRKDKRAVLQGFEASIGTRQELELRLEQERAQLTGVVQKHDQALEALKKAEAEFDVLHAKLRRLDEARLVYEKERDAAQMARVRLEERSKRAKSLVESIALIEDDFKRGLKPLAGAKSLDDALSEVKRDLVLAQDAVEQILAQAKQLEVAWREEISKLRAEREALTRQAAQLGDKIGKLGSLDAGGECPTCSQPLGETFESVLGHIEGERGELLKRAGVLAEREDVLQARPLDLIQREQSLEQAQNSLERMRIKAQELQKCQQLERKLIDLRTEQSANQGEVALAESAYQLATKRVAECNFAEDGYLKEKGAHDAAQRLVEVARLQRVRFEGEVNTQTAMVDRSQADLERFDERQGELERIRREVRVFDECDRIVTDFRKFINATIRPRMAELASEYLTDLTDGRYSAVELGEDFTPTVVEDGEAKRVISGGEEDILNLCMRIALSHMLAERAGQSFSLLMLDEVFGSLDEGRRGNVLALLEKLRRRFEQIVIITHLDDIKDGVQHLIQVEYDEGDGAARITQDGFELYALDGVGNL